MSTKSCQLLFWQGKINILRLLYRLTANAKVATVLASDPSILRHSGILGAAAEAALEKVHLKKSS